MEVTMEQQKRDLYTTRGGPEDYKSQDEQLRNEYAIMQAFLQHVREEYAHSRLKYPRLANGHTAYAVLLEEVEEVWQELKHPTDYVQLYTECMQVAAMCLAIVTEL